MITGLSTSEKQLVFCELVHLEPENGCGREIATCLDHFSMRFLVSVIDSQEGQDTRHSQLHLLYTHHMTCTDCKCLLNPSLLYKQIHSLFKHWQSAFGSKARMNINRLQHQTTGHKNNLLFRCKEVLYHNKRD